MQQLVGERSSNTTKIAAVGWSNARRDANSKAGAMLRGLLCSDQRLEIEMDIDDKWY